MSNGHIIEPVDGLIGETDFALIADLIRDLAGIQLNPSKRAMVSSRLSRRLKAHGQLPVKDYCALLRSRDGAAERGELISALTTNVTRFNREEHQFAHFETRVLPGLVGKLRAGERVRVWSAGCSSGEEACDLAFRLLDACPEAARLDCRILASDIDRAVLATARSGCYPRAALEPLSDAHIRKYFSPASAPGDQMKLSDDVRRLIAYRQLNLQSDWPFSGMFDTIMCRNVTIYFDARTQARLWRRFTAQLAPGGALYIGHSESISEEISRYYDGEGANVFRRKPDAETASMPPPAQTTDEEQP